MEGVGGGLDVKERRRKRRRLRQTDRGGRFDRVSQEKNTTTTPEFCVMLSLTTCGFFFLGHPVLVSRAL